MPDTELPMEMLEGQVLDHELITINDHPLLQMNVCIARDKGTYAPKRFLNPGKFEDLYRLHMHCQDPVSRSTLLHCWHQRWESMMPFRNFGQGKRFEICCVSSKSLVASMLAASWDKTTPPPPDWQVQALLHID